MVHISLTLHDLADLLDWTSGPHQILPEPVVHETVRQKLGNSRLRLFGAIYMKLKAANWLLSMRDGGGVQ